MILDGDDGPHIANDGYHLSFDGVDWHEEAIPGLTGTYHESIVLDPSGRPIISALDYYGGPVQCAHWGGSSWIVDDVATRSYAGAGNAIALDSAGRLHVTYRKGKADELRYASREKTGWETTVVTESTSGQTSLAIDGNDIPHVGFYRDGGFAYAVRTGDEWAIEMIDDDLDGQNTIAVDNANRPHAAYLGHGHTRYAVRNEGVWQSEKVIDYDHTVDLALDATGRPNLIYFTDHDYEYDIYHAVRNDGVWTSDLIDSGSYLGGSTAAAIAISNDGHLHVGYDYGGASSELRYAHWDGELWQIEVAKDYAGDIERICLVIDDAGQPFMVYMSHNALLYAERSNAGWSTGRVVPGWNSTSFDLVTDGNFFYVSFTNWQSGGLLLATSRPLGLDNFIYLPMVMKH